ncbi:MAG: M14 family zinc carboxypeptidase [Bacteroidales bacterium]|nr:M14 family zinc carboxypeptidase [Bacteroidales bacterium]
MTKRILIVLLPLFMSSGTLFSQILFSTGFESGSLGEATITDSVLFSTKRGDTTLYLSYQINSRFDPFNPIDTTLRPSARWYYFKMVGVKDKMVYLNIKNSEAIRPFFSYDGENFSRFTSSENPEKGLLVKRYERDTVYISHYIPYTWSRHKMKLDEWSLKPFVHREEIGKSTNGLPIEMITITDSEHSDINKKRIWIHGRSHPSEQPASWHLEALTDYILSERPEAVDLRKNSIIYIVPFINPDGVYGGYSRSSSTGVNIEINWDKPDSLTMPEIAALKFKMKELMDEKPFDLVLNMHSQIANSVTYWIHNAESTTERFLQKQLLLSALTMDDRRFYREADQSFSAVASRYVEGWIWDKYKEETLAITFETPYTYYKENPNEEWVSIENLAELAEDSFFAINDFLMIQGSYRFILEPERLKGTGWSERDDSSMTFFGESYFVDERENGRVVFKHDNLNKGVYKIYNYKSNRWEYMGRAIQRRDGRFVWRSNSSQFNGEVDAILLVKEEN